MAWIIQRNKTTTGSSRRRAARVRAVAADLFLFPERVFADPPARPFLLRLEFADRGRLLAGFLLAAVLLPDPLRDAVVVVFFLAGAGAGAGAGGRGAFPAVLTVVGRITSSGSSL
jgi:hypothetical protein